MRSTRHRLIGIFIWLATAAGVTTTATGLGACGASAAGLNGGIRRGALASDQVAAHDALVAAGDAAFAARADRAQLEAAIGKYAEAVALVDDDWHTYEKLARATYLLADGWLYFEQDTRMPEFLATYEKGYTTAQRGLAALSPELEKKLATGVDLKDAVALVGKEGVGLMYWYAANLGKWGNAQDITVVLKYKERIFNTMSRVLSLDPTFFFGAPERYFGAYYAIAPSFAGGDLDQSWTHFQEAIKIEAKYLATYNLIAENYAPKRQDKRLFDEMTQKVLDAPLDGIPGLEAEAAVEKRKAAALRERAESGDIPF